MTRVRAVVYTALALVAVAVLSMDARAAGCGGGSRVARFLAIAVDRCARQDVTISFEGGVHRDRGRVYVTVSREDGKRLYELLDRRYGKAGK